MDETPKRKLKAATLYGHLLDFLDAEPLDWDQHTILNLLDALKDQIVEEAIR